MSAAIHDGIAVLGAAEFEVLRRLVHQASGIHLQDGKRDLVQNRLSCRLRKLGLGNFVEYVDFIRADTTGAELEELVNRMTTNKTSFFREGHHFDFIANKVIPELLKGNRKRLRFWSAGCSTGEEPWTLAMTVLGALPYGGDWDVRILASDLDTEVLAKAEDAVYRCIDGVPAALVDRFFVSTSEGYRVSDALRALVTFRRVNLVEPSTWNIRTKFDAVLCRNVAIYFERETQHTVFRALAGYLEPNGYLMSGHAENLQQMTDVLRPLGGTIHALARRANRTSRRPRATSIPVLAQRTALIAQNPPVISEKPRGRRRSLRPSVRATECANSSVRPTKDGEMALDIGGVHASGSGTIVRTTLGSCVAACVYDPEARVGGMNHFLLPHPTEGGRIPTSFGVHAMDELLQAVLSLGARRDRVLAKVFGASEIFPTSGAEHVARLNAEFALGYLERKGVRVVAKKLGGPSPLSVRFDTATGRATVKTLGNMPELIQVENGYADRLLAHRSGVRGGSSERRS